MQGDALDAVWPCHLPQPQGGKASCSSHIFAGNSSAPQPLLYFFHLRDVTREWQVKICLHLCFLFFSINTPLASGLGLVVSCEVLGWLEQSTVRDHKPLQGSSEHFQCPVTMSSGCLMNFAQSIQLSTNCGPFTYQPTVIAVMCNVSGLDETLSGPLNIKDDQGAKHFKISPYFILSMFFPSSYPGIVQTSLQPSLGCPVFLSWFNYSMKKLQFIALCTSKYTVADFFPNNLKTG